MKQLIIIFLFCITCKMSYAEHPSIPYLKKSIYEMMLDSKMDYETTLKMPDASVTKAQGVMAFLGPQNYYDSSNTRFILQNNQWYIGADHLDKTIKIVNMKLWNKMYGNEISLGHISYLLDADSSEFSKANFNLTQLQNENYRLDISFRAKESDVKKITIVYNLNSKIPIEYSGEIVIPVDYETIIDKVSQQETEVPVSYAVLTFSCKNIQRADKQIFDHSRIIRREKNRDVILRYPDYKTLAAANNKTKKSK